MVNQKELKKLRRTVQGMDEKYRRLILDGERGDHPEEVAELERELQQRAAVPMPRVFLNDAAIVPDTADDHLSGEAPTHFTIRHVDLLRKVLDEVATGVRQLLVGLVAAGKFVRISASPENPRSWYQVSTTDNVYAGAGSDGIPTTHKLDLVEDIVVQGDPAEIAASEGNFVVGADLLLGSLKEMFKAPANETKPKTDFEARRRARRDKVYQGAQQLFRLLKAFEHRGLLVNRTLHDNLASEGVAPKLQTVIGHVLNPGLIDETMDREDLAEYRTEAAESYADEAKEKVANCRKSCGRLLDAFMTLSNFKCDTEEEARAKLVALRANLHRAEETSAHAKAREIVTTVLGSRFGLHAAPAEGGAAAGDNPEATAERVDGDFEVHGLTVAVPLPGGGFYLLPDAFSTYNVDIASRAFDYFTITRRSRSLSRTTSSRPPRSPRAAGRSTCLTRATGGGTARWRR